MLIDSNVIIYATQPQYDDLRQFIDGISRSVSVVSYIEVLGYHRLGKQQRQLLEQFFQGTDMLPLSDAVMHQSFPPSQRGIHRLTGVGIYMDGQDRQDGGMGGMDPAFGDFCITSQTACSGSDNSTLPTWEGRFLDSRFRGNDELLCKGLLLREWRGRGCDAAPLWFPRCDGGTGPSWSFGAFRRWSRYRAMPRLWRGRRRSVRPSRTRHGDSGGGGSGCSRPHL